MQLRNSYPKLDLTELEIPAPETPLTNADIGIVRLCLASKNLQEIHARLVTEGVRFLSPPQPCKDRMAYIATCADPDGTLIELLEADYKKWPKPPSSR